MRPSLCPRAAAQGVQEIRGDFLTFEDFFLKKLKIKSFLFLFPI